MASDEGPTNGGTGESPRVPAPSTNDPGLSDTAARVGAAITAISDIYFRFQRVLEPVLSLTSWLVFPPLVGTFLSWTVMAILFYQSGRWLYGELPRSKPLAEIYSPALGVLFTATALSTGLLFDWANATGPPRLTKLFMILISLSFASSLVFGGYIHFMTDPPWFGVGGSFSMIFRLYLPSDLEERLLKEDIRPSGEAGLRGRCKRVEMFVSVGLLLAFPALLAGLLGALLNLLLLPDVLLLLWVLRRPRTRMVADSSEVTRRNVPDIAGHLSDGLQHAQHNTKGAILTTFVLVGGVGSVLLFWQAGQIYSALATVGLRLFVARTSAGPVVVLWGVIGTFTLLYLAGAYGLWAWIREFHRLGSFLQYWEKNRYPAGNDRTSVLERFATVVSGYSPDDPVAVQSDRVPFFVFVPYVLVGTVGTFWNAVIFELQIERVYGANRELWLVWIAWASFGVIWPILCYVTIRIFRSQTDGSDTTTVTLPEKMVVVIAFVVLVLLRNSLLVFLIATGYALLWRHRAANSPTSVRFEDAVVGAGLLILIDSYRFLLVPVPLHMISLFVAMVSFIPDLERVPFNDSAANYLIVITALLGAIALLWAILASGSIHARFLLGVVGIAYLLGLLPAVK